MVPWPWIDVHLGIISIQSKRNASTLTCLNALIQVRRRGQPFPVSKLDWANFRTLWISYQGSQHFVQGKRKWEPFGKEKNGFSGLGIWELRCDSVGPSRGLEIGLVQRRGRDIPTPRILWLLHSMWVRKIIWGQMPAGDCLQSASLRMWLQAECRVWESAGAGEAIPGFHSWGLDSQSHDSSQRYRRSQAKSVWTRVHYSSSTILQQVSNLQVVILQHFCKISSSCS